MDNAHGDRRHCEQQSPRSRQRLRRAEIIDDVDSTNLTFRFYNKISVFIHFLSLLVFNCILQLGLLGELLTVRSLSVNTNGSKRDRQFHISVIKDGEPDTV